MNEVHFPFITFLSMNRRVNNIINTNNRVQYEIIQQIQYGKRGVYCYKCLNLPNKLLKSFGLDPVNRGKLIISKPHCKT